MKIKFNKIIIHHFLSYDHAEVDFNDKGFCLVKGINRNPKDSAKSNGSGKSTIFNALSYVLTGETLQGLKSNLANIYYGDGCYVKLDFVVDGKEYTLLRSKDDATYGTNLKITIDGVDKSGKGIRESEEALEGFLPDLTSELIGSVILIGQNMPMKFTDNSPSGRKEVLEHLTQSDYMIQDLKDRIAERTDVLNRQIRAQEDTILSKSSKLEVIRGNLAKNRQEYVILYGPDAVVRDFDAEEAECEKEIARLKDLLITAAADLINAKDKLKYSMSERQEVNVLKEREHGALLMEEQNALNTYVSRQTELNNSKKALLEEITKMKSITDVCPTCGQKIPNVIKPDTSGKEQELFKVQKNLEEVVKLKEDAIELYTVKEKELLNKYANSIKEAEENVTNCDKLVNELNDRHSKINYDVALRENAKANIVKDRELFNTSKQRLEQSIEEQEKQKTEFEEEISLAKIDLEKLNEHLSVVNKMNTIIKRDFRGFLLKNIIEYIDSKAKEYASQIFGCNEVDFTLDGNNIGIAFSGKDYENLSGGEKQRVDLIIQFALRDFISQYLSFYCNILVLDEITDALDSESCEKVVNFIINELSSVESVFIISHHADELELPCDSELVVEKSADGVSRVVV